VGVGLPVRRHRHRPVLKLLDVVDEFTRESLAEIVAHSIDADATVAHVDKIVGLRGGSPTFTRCDNGPELTANALRDWCRFTRSGTSYIEPGSPWENPWVESYGSRIREELWPSNSSISRPRPRFSWLTGASSTTPTDHSALGLLTPVQYAQQWRRTNQPPLS
jgi:putative transposase